MVGRTNSLWGISSLLTSDSTLNVFICLLEYHALLLGAMNVIVYWTGKNGWGVCVLTGHSKLTAYHVR